MAGETKSALYHYIDGRVLYGPTPEMQGDCSGLWGDCTNLSGNCTKLRGDCTGLSGDCTGLLGGYATNATEPMEGTQ